MEAMRTQNLRMPPKMYVLVHHVPKYVGRTGIPLEPTSDLALESPHTLFDIFSHRFEVNCTKPPSFENVYLTLHYVITRAICK